MTELNHTQHAIKVLGPYTFSIGDTSGFSTYSHDGIIKQVKPKKELHFVRFFPPSLIAAYFKYSTEPLSLYISIKKRLRESIEAPTFTDTDFGGPNQPIQLHLAFLALNEWIYQHSGTLPLPHHQVRVKS